MTPAARAAASIELLDAVLDGRAVEGTIAAWSRRNRYAGSSDRSAIRDMVYDALRRRRSLAAWGGRDDGRGLILGALRLSGDPVESVFGVGRYGPPPLAEHERAAPVGPWPEVVALDCPDFLLSRLKRSLGAKARPVMSLLRTRAEVHIRANTARTTVEALGKRLAEDGVTTEPHPLSPSAMAVREGARRLRRLPAFLEGLFELQDAASQAVADAVPVAPGARVLDYCAGAGGKTLAMAGRVDATWYVHDAYPERMADLPERAARAGCEVIPVAPGDAALAECFDTVLVDAPCSGSGAWRRDPEAKWALTSERLDELCVQQAQILDGAAALVAASGTLAYATCSLLQEENTWQVEAFLRRHRDWRLTSRMTLTPLDGGDGFFLALLKR